MATWPPRFERVCVVFIVPIARFDVGQNLVGRTSVMQAVKRYLFMFTKRNHRAHFYLMCIACLAGVASIAGAGTVTLTRESVYTNTQINDAVAFGDLNNDGYDDVVYAYRTLDSAPGQAAHFTLEWRVNPGP